MTTGADLGAVRRELLGYFFPGGLPALWCPLLTHYRADGSVDDDRFLAHLEHVASWVHGVLVPGSTGDGWELTEAERLRVLGLVLDQATRLKIQLLVGVLKPTSAAMLASLVGTVEWLKTRCGEQDILRCLSRRRIGGFTLCAPAGAKWSQSGLEKELSGLLSTGLPIALYQLPQVTGNELDPATVVRLAERYPNLLLFKDSSGLDRVAQTAPQPSALFMLRGAEGNYARWLRGVGGVYDGLMLSSANCFPKELRRLVRDVERGRIGPAGMVSERLSSAVEAVFDCVKRTLTPGNAFASANKAIDHFMAFGPQAAQVASPRLHGNRVLPLEVLRETSEILRRYDLMPLKGYLD